MEVVLWEGRLLRGVCGPAGRGGFVAAARPSRGGWILPPRFRRCQDSCYLSTQFSPLQFGQQIARKVKGVDDSINAGLQQMIKDVVQVDKDLVFGDSARRGAHFVHVSCRYATNWGFLDPAELAQQPRSEPVNQRVGAWNAARRAAGSTLSDVDLEKEFAEQLCALRSACQAPVLPQGSSWLVNILSQKLRMCAEQKKLEDCQRVMNKEQVSPTCAPFSCVS